MNYGIDNIKFSNVKYGKEIDGIFNFLSDNQLKDKKLWETLVFQFVIKTDKNDNGWRGEFWGKLMRGASLVYSYTKDEELYEILHNTVNALLNAADEKGLIRTYSDDKEFCGWDIWSRKYVMLGLNFYLDICKDDAQKEKIITALSSLADYMIEKVGDGKGRKAFNRTSGLWGCMNSYSILQPIVKLYKLTGDKKYLDYATEIIKTNDVRGMNIFEKAYEDRIAPFEYAANKAYEMVSCFEGLLEYYEATGIKDCLLTVDRFAKKLLATDFTLIGGTGCKSEQLDNSTARQVVHSPNEMQETCVTVTIIKFFTQLYLHSKDTVYMDAVERAFYNLYIGAINFGYKKDNKFPIFLSYSPILDSPRWRFTGGRKNIAPGTQYGCCISIGAVGLGMIPRCSAFAQGENVYISFLSDASYSIETQNGLVEFTVSGGYPDNGKLKIRLTKVPENGVYLNIRKPTWCKNYTVSSEKFALNNGFIASKNKLTKRLDLELDFEMPIECVLSESVNHAIDYRIALTKGPIVLAQDSFYEDVPFYFDLDEDSVNKITDELGRVAYNVKMRDGSFVTLNKYCDCAKQEIDIQRLNVWFRRK